MNELISVIIPVYQAENYLKRCLETIINQTYKKLEILLIVDGATDRSLEICREYAAKDNRIIVQYQENAGQSAARNRAFEMATGEYLAFCDSDDFTENNMLEELYNAIVKNNCDMAFCSIYKYNADGSKTLESYYSEDIVINHDYLMQEGIADKIPGYPCNKLIKRKCMENIRFIQGIKYEDLEWVPRLFDNITRAVYVDKPLYHYAYNSGSTCNAAENFERNLYFVANAFYLRYEYVKKHYPQYLEFATARLIPAILNYIAIYNPDRKKNTGSQQLFQMLDDFSIVNIIKNKNILLKNKSKYILYKINRGAFIKLQKHLYKNKGKIKNI